MSRVIHFEIPSDNPEKALVFYEKVFGWKVSQWTDAPYWLCTTGEDSEPGINGAIMKRNSPDQPLLNTIGVKNIDETIQSIQAHGGVVVSPKRAIENVGWLAFFKDLDGNILGVIEQDEKAK